jgi:hypothetical protein
MIQVALFTIGVLLGVVFGASAVAATSLITRVDEIQRNRGE